MELQRLYEKDKDGAPVRIKGVQIRHAGAKQNFSPDWFTRAKREGDWLVLSGDVICVNGEDRKGEKLTVRYRVVRKPGFYCCHCGEQLEGNPADPIDCADNSGRLAHVASFHAGEKSPDPSNPAGYMGMNYYQGELIAE